MPEFTHLHLHTQYSLLDGAIRLDQLFPKVLERGMKSVAITDHGNLFGALDFYQRAKAHGVKPIFGCETYVAPDRLDKTERRSQPPHPAREERGRLEEPLVPELDGVPGGLLLQPAHRQAAAARARRGPDRPVGLPGRRDRADHACGAGPRRRRTAAREFEDIFGKGNFFLELQPNGLEEQEQVNGHLIEMSKKTGIGVVATNDCHYLNQDDARAHEILMCVQQKKTIHDEKRLHHRNDAFFVKTPAEMEAYFKHIPEALENAAQHGRAVQRRVQAGRDVPAQVPGARRDDAPSRTCRRSPQDGPEEAHRGGAPRAASKIDGDAYAARLALELGVIQKMHFAGLLPDRLGLHPLRQGPPHPGRARAAGRAPARWSRTRMRITDIDPIANKLLFERFLNPERVSMPDFDIDFCMNRRDEVIGYVTDKYGKDNVGQIVTMHQIKARSGVRDIARAMAMPFAEADKVAKFVPEPIQGKSPPIAEAIEKEPRLKALYDENPTYRELLDVAKRLEGLNRHAGKHAAGVVIGDRPLWEYVPCFRPAGDEAGIVTQYDKDMVEKAGLVKFDFLGLKTLTVIQICLDHVNREQGRARRGRSSIWRSIPLDDAEVYKMISAGGRDRRLPAGVVGLPRAAEEAAPRLLRGHRRRRRALPARAAGGRHGRRLHRAQARAQAGRVRPPDAGADPEGHLRRHRLPGAGHADLVGAGRLQPGQGRSASPRDGQEEGGGHGQGEGRLPRRRQGEERSTARSPSASSI